MLKVKYQIEALSQIHTGADESNGTVTLLRREKRQIKNPMVINSKFASIEDRTKALTLILLCIYKSINSELKSNNYGFYDAFSAKILECTRVRTKHEFLTELCASCSIRTLSDIDSALVKDSIDMFDDDEFLSSIREQHQYLMLMLRYAVKNNIDKDSLTSKASAKGIEFQKDFEWVPFVAGNSIRGLIRRLLMRDFLERIGVDKESYGVDKDMYHQLMTGGNITSSTAYEDIELREKYIKLCPAIGLLGSAIGNMTIEGKLITGAMRPKCKEHGTSNVSFWQMVSKTFGTRHDTSKTEIEIGIVSDKTKSSSPNQMKYGFEVFNIGTFFDSEFIVRSNDSLLISVFWHAVELWRSIGIIGGSSARGYGRIALDIDMPKNANAEYIKYLESVKKDALAFFAVKRQ